jgi:glycine betaine/proline transport system permease protein
MLDFFAAHTIPLDDWTQSLVEWLTLNLRPFFQMIRWPVAHTLDGVEAVLVGAPPSVVLGLAFVLAWQVAGLRVAAFTVAALLFLGFTGVWTAAMTTVSLVATAVLFCLLIGVPLGLLAGRSNRFEAAIRPLLDAMQTLPGFVYLVPIVMLVGIGNVPGVLVTVVFALPPIIRLTSLGLRQVPDTIVEAAYSFGSSPWQVLVKIQLPIALPTILLGINQTLMMALSMVVIASMIAVGGLGQMVLQGIGRLDIGLATVGGIGIVVLAMVLDRVTQGAATPAGENATFYRRGPIGLALMAANKRPRAPGPADALSDGRHAR